MTRLLERAITEIQNLPPTDQDAIASLILEEIADDRRWDEAFAKSHDRLAQIAEQVRAEIRAGKVQALRLEEL